MSLQINITKAHISKDTYYANAKNTEYYMTLRYLSWPSCLIINALPIHQERGKHNVSMTSCRELQVRKCGCPPGPFGLPISLWLATVRTGGGGAGWAIGLIQEVLLFLRGKSQQFLIQSFALITDSITRKFKFPITCKQIPLFNISLRCIWFINITDHIFWNRSYIGEALPFFLWLLISQELYLY